MTKANISKNYKIKLIKMLKCKFNRKTEFMPDKCVPKCPTESEFTNLTVSALIKKYHLNS